jgi:hypothetical protein
MLALLAASALINLRWNFGWRFPSSQAGIDVRYGYVEVGWPRDLPSVAFSLRPSSPHLPLLPRLDIAHRGDGALSSMQYHQLAVPIWMLLAASVSLLPLLRIRRVAHDVCSYCTYDLSGVPLVRICPECGRSRDDAES